jgi:hypothetical protein
MREDEKAKEKQSTLMCFIWNGVKSDSTGKTIALETKFTLRLISSRKYISPKATGKRVDKCI